VRFPGDVIWTFGSESSSEEEEEVSNSVVREENSERRLFVADDVDVVE
jgi:hypothetical protein